MSRHAVEGRADRTVPAALAVWVSALALLGAGCGTAGPQRASEPPPPAAYADSGPVVAVGQGLPGRAERAYRERRWRDAAALYAELSERIPDDAHAWFRLGNAYSHQGAFERAEAAYRRAIERDAQDPRPWFNLSTAYLMRARHSMMQAWAALPAGDATRLAIESRLRVLAELVEVSGEQRPANHFGADG